MLKSSFTYLGRARKDTGVGEIQEVASLPHSTGKRTDSNIAIWLALTFEQLEESPLSKH